MRTEFSVRGVAEKSDDVRKVVFWLKEEEGAVSLMFSDSENSLMGEWYLFSVYTDGSMVLHDGVERTFIGDKMVEDERE